MEGPYPKVSSVKMTNAKVKVTDSLASYRSSCNFNLKFYNRMSVLWNALTLNR